MIFSPQKHRVTEERQGRPFASSCLCVFAFKYLAIILNAKTQRHEDAKGLPCLSSVTLCLCGEKKLVRRCFTLLELLVVLSILSTASVLIGLSIFKSVKEQNFKTEVNLVAGQLELAQELMLTLNVDVKVKFAELPNGKGLLMILEPQQYLSSSVWKKLLEHNTLALTHIKNIVWITSSEEVKNSQITLAFFSKGLFMSKGVLRLMGSSDSWIKDIFVKGYPSPLQIQSPIENPFKEDHDQLDFLEKLTQATRQELEATTTNEKPSPQTP